MKVIGVFVFLTCTKLIYFSKLYFLFIILFWTLNLPSIFIYFSFKDMNLLFFSDKKATISSIVSCYFINLSWYSLHCLKFLVFKNFSISRNIVHRLEDFLFSINSLLIEMKAAYFAFSTNDQSWSCRKIGNIWEASLSMANGPPADYQVAHKFSLPARQFYICVCMNLFDVIIIKLVTKLMDK